MDASCYIPNNPQYGLQLEWQWNPVQPGSSNGLVQNGSIDGELDVLSPNGTTTCWAAEGSGGPGPGPDTSDDMGSFSMPLDLDPLPTLFPFSPCTAAVYKTESNCSPPTQPKEKPVHDMADVLLSLKHAIIHPGQAGNEQVYQQHVNQTQPPPQLSYTVHPHQMLMSPSGYTYCEQLPASGYQTHHGGVTSGGGVTQVNSGSAPPAIFPSMSVNVSMNMTYHPSSIPGYDQMQWTPAPQCSSPGYVQNQTGLLSPSYGGGATYSFTADFRPPTLQEPPLITASSSFKPVLNGKTQFSPLRNMRKMNYMSPGKGQMCEEDNQRPNLCRICGKTYARPSTLKTHLRTHSGEKPYRCMDCNKSFSQAANLTAHVRTHSGEKPFRCPICDRRFSQSSSVTTHMRTHSGERPYRCRMCKKAFSDSSTLTKHLRIHSGEKPYQCKLCLLRFSQSGNLNRHMRVHGTNNAMLV